MPASRLRFLSRSTRLGALIAFIAVTSFVGLLYTQSALQVPSGTFAPTGPMAEARAGASAALLPDGRTLITGGSGASGALASAEYFSGGAFSAAPAMATARSRHASVTLKDGRVLVTGGTTTGGAPTNSAEIFFSGSWSAASATMTEARAGHTASLLSDGRVLIAGGANTSGVSQTVDIFDPATGLFSYVGQLSLPRKNHAAALLADGRILIAGGSFGGTSLRFLLTFLIQPPTRSRPAPGWSPLARAIPLLLY